jgi:hypothetical protein
MRPLAVVGRFASRLTLCVEMAVGAGFLFLFMLVAGKDAWVFMLPEDEKALAA